MSVGNAGCGAVRMSTALRAMPSARPRSSRRPLRPWRPLRAAWHMTASRVSGWACVVRILPPVMAAATRKVPVSIRSAMMRWSRAVQLVDAMDGDDAAAGAFDPRAHGDQALAPGPPLPVRAQRSPARWCLQPELAAIIRFSVPVTVTISITMRAPLRRLGRARGYSRARCDLRAHRLQALDVQVDRARTDGAAARQRNARLAEARERRPQHQDGRAHGLHHLVGRLQHRGLRRAQAHAVPLVQRHAHAHVAEQGQHGADVLQMRHVVEFQGSASAGGSQDRQRGILGAGNANLPGEADCRRGWTAYPFSVWPSLRECRSSSTVRGSLHACGRPEPCRPAGAAGPCSCRETRR